MEAHSKPLLSKESQYQQWSSKAYLYVVCHIRIMSGDAVDDICKFHPGMLLAKLDIKNAYILSTACISSRQTPLGNATYGKIWCT